MAGSTHSSTVGTSRLPGAVTVATALGCFTLGTALAPPFHGVGDVARVAALQPNVPLEYRWDRDNLAEIQDRVFRHTVEAARAGAIWAVWPESAVPRVIERDGTYRAEIEKLARLNGIWLTVGSIGIGPGEDEYANSVFQVSPGAG